MTSSNRRTTTGSAAGVAADLVQSLTIDIRASTQGFAQDIAAMRGTFDGTLVDGFSKAGGVLDTGLTTAIGRASAGFTSLRGLAMGVIDDIAAQASGNLFASLGADSGAGGIGGLLGVSALVAMASGLPGRATGGAVSPGQPYLVGERGPEVFVPTAAGAVASSQGQPGRDLNVSITVAAPATTDAPQSLQRSSRQVAAAVRRALNAA